MDPPPPLPSVETVSSDTAVKPLDVSYGVEFEFILVESFPEEQARPYRTKNDKCYYGLSQVANVLKNALFQCRSCGEQFHVPIGIQDESEDWKPDHSQWNVVSDDSMQLSKSQKKTLWNGGCDVFGVEVTSRKLFADRDVTIPTDSKSDHQHTITSEEEIRTILDALNRAFNSPAAAKDGRIIQWLVTNKTCGLHVHVGNDEEGFPLQTVKNVLSLSTAFERVIDRMHSRPRIGGTALALTALDALDDELGAGDDRDNVVRSLPIAQREVANMPLTQHYISNAWRQRRNTARPLPPPTSATSTTTPSSSYPAPHTANNPTLAQAASGLHTAAFLQVIQAAPDLESLIQTVFLKETTVTIMSMRQGSGFPKNFEFRQHAAVTNAADTVPWIEFVVALVRYAHGSRAEVIREVCTRVATDPELTLEDLLILLTMGQNMMFHWLDRVDNPQAGSDLFFDHVAARAEVEAAFGDDGPLRKVALELIDEWKEKYDHGAVAKAVRDKFDAGGYGQFSRDFIDDFAPDLSEEVKVKLTIGWEAAVASEPESEPEFELGEIEGVEDIEES